ncbi:MAG: alpha/beta hydrolase-fold protein [Planctomycetes bacterium]|nr:alpha/beta hydrolase-fold protein [Planctomycetota bacterium]
MRVHYERFLGDDFVLKDFSMDSECLKGNPLGDPTERSHPMLAPPQGQEGLPLVVILVGFTGFGHKLLNKGSLWEETLPERLARGMAAGDIPPAVFLWPSCETALGGSQYRNSAATGEYETHLMSELIPRVESEGGCGGAGARVIAGKSSGGYGALTLVMRNPGFFRAAACHAGDMGFEGYANEFLPALSCWHKHGGPKEFLGALSKGQISMGHAEHAALDVLGMASCYAPNAEAPLGFDLPVDPETGEPDVESFQRWFEHDPVRMVESEQYADALRNLDELYLDAGERDEFGLQWGLRRFVKRLQAADIEHHVEYFNGGHFDMDARYEISLPKILRPTVQSSKPTGS